MRRMQNTAKCSQMERKSTHKLSKDRKIKRSFHMLFFWKAIKGKVNPHLPPKGKNIIKSRFGGKHRILIDYKFT